MPTRFRFFLMVLVATAAFAASPRPKDIPVHSYFQDWDATNVPYTIQSDGAGAYIDGTGNIVSVLMANVYNNLYNGDWQMDGTASTTRTVAVTLASTNAIPPGDPGYTVPPNPPFWGTRYLPARLIDKCTQYNKSLLTMQPGTTFTCPLLLRWNNPGGGFYRLDMGDNEATPAQISCNSADSLGCNDWYLDPVPVVNPDGSVAPGKAIARLVYSAKNGAITNLGDFYMTFHFHVTRP